MPIAKRPESYRRRGYYQSKKTGDNLYYQSSYELRALVLLDEDNTVSSLKTQLVFFVGNKKRYMDILVEYKDGSTKLIEIKDQRRLDKGIYDAQIKDNNDHADLNGWGFEVWTEPRLGFASEYLLTKWADQFISEMTGIDFVAIRKQLNNEKVKKYYKEKIAEDKVEVWCEYCKKTHDPLRITYEDNIARNNGEYVCERKGGRIAGSRPKDHLKKKNPYAAEGKKQCTKCFEVKTFSEFGTDKDRRDGYANRCKKCRAEAAAAKYQAKKGASS